MGGFDESGRRRHILVVDDDRDMRECMTEALELAGYSVAAAQDGLRALEYLRAPPQVPDLILLDLAMPNMGGVEFRQEQLKSDEHAAIPVALVTAERNGAQLAEELGTSGFLSKPIELPRLLDLVARLVKTG